MCRTSWTTSPSGTGRRLWREGATRSTLRCPSQGRSHTLPQLATGTVHRPHWTTETCHQRCLAGSVTSSLLPALRPCTSARAQRRDMAGGQPVVPPERTRGRGHTRARDTSVPAIQVSSGRPGETTATVCLHAPAPRTRLVGKQRQQREVLPFQCRGPGPTNTTHPNVLIFQSACNYVARVMDASLRTRWVLHMLPTHREHTQVTYPLHYIPGIRQTAAPQYASTLATCNANRNGRTRLHTKAARQNANDSAHASTTFRLGPINTQLPTVPPLLAPAP